jgi:hypothetical protein
MISQSMYVRFTLSYPYPQTTLRRSARELLTRGNCKRLFEVSPAETGLYRAGHRANNKIPTGKQTHQATLASEGSADGRLHLFEAFLADFNQGSGQAGQWIRT